MAQKQCRTPHFLILSTLVIYFFVAASGKTLYFSPKENPDEKNVGATLEKLRHNQISSRTHSFVTDMKSRSKNVINNLTSFLQSQQLPLFNCPCTWPPYCTPISKPPQKELVIFSVSNNASHWAHYDWKRITTIIMFDYYNADLMCLAHKNGARAVVKISFPLANVTNTTETDAFIKKTATMVTNFHLDGVNFDMEDPIDKSDFKRINAFTAFVTKTVSTVKALNKNYQVTFDAAWSPNCIDQRCYDLFAISKVVDYLFIMAYDEQSQMHDKVCQAKANSGFNKTVTGVLQYIQKNIPREKLILGVPWYGYDYPCISLDKNDVCTIKKVPFRGAPCSDAAGSQRSYSDIEKQLSEQHLIRRWNNATSTPFYNYKDTNGTFHQVWFDDVQSLSMKYAFAVKVGLGGVGMWNVDSLNYSAPEEAVFKAMWEALPKFPTKK